MKINKNCHGVVIGTLPCTMNIQIWFNVNVFSIIVRLFEALSSIEL